MTFPAQIYIPEFSPISEPIGFGRTVETDGKYRSRKAYVARVTAGFSAANNIARVNFTRPAFPFLKIPIANA
jgi:hypothetical protein